MSDRNTIDILSENPIEQVWLYLSRLESVPLARKAIAARADEHGSRPLARAIAMRAEPSSERVR